MPAFRSNIDLGGNQLLNTLMEVLAAAPGAGPQGRLIYRSDIGKLQWHNGTTYVGPYLDTTRLDQIVAPSAAVAMNGQKLTGLADGTAATDAVTRQQLDSVSAGLDPKGSVRAATTANIALTGTQTIDGVAVIAGDRVLAKNQTNKAENGIWIVAAGAWARPTDADAGGELSGGAHVFVEEGTTQADTGWVVTTNGSITPGTTAHDWSQFTGAGSTLGGSGLTQTGQVLDVNVDGASIEINADVLRVKALGIVTAMLAAGAVDLTTKVSNTLPVANGGTGAASAAAARTALGAVGKFAADVTGDGTTTSFAVTHSLATTDVQVQVWEATTNAWVLTDVVRTSTNVVTVSFATAPAVGKVYRVVVVG